MGKPEYPEKNFSKKSRKPTNSIHIWRRVWESNLSHIGGRRVLSPLPLHETKLDLNSPSIKALFSL